MSTARMDRTGEMLSQRKRHLVGLRQPRCLASAVVAITLVGGAAVAQTADRPKLFTHESYVEDVLRSVTLDVGDPRSMFAFVFGSLPDRVKVYPTENYYYFRFVTAATQYAGNLRLDIFDRDQGKVHFAYYEDLAEWKEQSPITHVVLDRGQGVIVEKLAPLVYRITFNDKAVTFELNDLSQVVPPQAAVAPDETYIGPIFDDSAIRFFLVFNPKLKIFHYVLDETIKVADQLTPAISTDRILIGKRTGFAFYRDHHRDRKILIGVFEGNGRVNNYFDGPFDQLPDNFIEGDTFRRTLLAVEPSLAGKIDRLGGSPDGSSRFLIAPYLYYRTEADLMVVHDCATSKKVPRAEYYACFVVEQNFDDETAAPSPRPRKQPIGSTKRRRSEAARR